MTEVYDNDLTITEPQAKVILEDLRSGAMLFGSSACIVRRRGTMNRNFVIECVLNTSRVTWTLNGYASSYKKVMSEFISNGAERIY